MKGRLFRDMRHACKRRRKNHFSGCESQQVSRRLIFKLMLYNAFSAPDITVRYFHYLLIRNRHFCTTKFDDIRRKDRKQSPFSVNLRPSNWTVNSIAMMLFHKVIIPKRLLSLKRDSHYRFSLFTNSVLRARAIVTCLL